MSGIQMRGRWLDVRPDRVDLRDRVYAPQLKSLPRQFPGEEAIGQCLPLYAGRHEMILDQGEEGACTGFGLAAMINYLLWRGRFIKGDELTDIDADPPPKASTRMLYHMARLYDEWPGEDYDGSSCRGAMKGWHHHGVCSEGLWPYRDPRGNVRFLEPREGWREDAVGRVLGAYYRINKDSINDLQAAIYEVGAVFASAMVHDGWFPDRARALDDALIDGPQREPSGGHAFAFVGYTPKGFVVQNSWGPGWGYHGFGLLSYADWVEHGMDAWVAVLGAPMAGVESRTTRSSASLRIAVANERIGPQPAGAARTPRYIYENPDVKPLSEEDAYCHALVVSNNGTPINRIVTTDDAEAALDLLAYRRPYEWLKERGSRKLVIYAHGGLNTEAASINRIRVMAPYFLANGIYPLFFTWQTGFLESFRFIFSDWIWGTEPAPPDPARASIWRAVREQLGEARDRSIEFACQQFIKPIWTQMKQNASAATQTGGGLHGLTKHLRRLDKELDDLEVHLVGHSAGAIALGHLLDSMGRGSRRITSPTCTLWAPACTMEFANRYYGRAVEKGVLAGAKDLYVELLSNERELGDEVGGVYGKSLLYLVSRALEDAHKTPLLGLHLAWQPPPKDRERWHSNGRKPITDWLTFRNNTAAPLISDELQVSSGPYQIPNAHGAFDNNVSVVERVLKRVLHGGSSRQRLEHRVENLTGY